MAKTFSNIEQLARLKAQTRRTFLGGMSGLAGSLFMNGAFASEGGGEALSFKRDPTTPLAALPPQFAPKARRVIFLHMVGAPSQLELFDHKPDLARFDGEDCPASFLEGKRFAFISGVPKMLGPQFPFHQAGQSGAWISDRLPHLEKHLDELCIVKTMRTDQFNHAPAQLMMHTGAARFGFPSMGSWVGYGLGTENQNLPGFIVLLSGGGTPDGGKQIWGSGFLPSVYQGVECRSQGDPVLYLSNPSDVSRSERRHVLDAISQIDQLTYEQFSDPETLTRIAQYEMAFRMQMEASSAMDITRESQSVLSRYGAAPGEASFSNNCLIARRLIERDVRFVQLYDRGWDSHGTSAAEDITLGFADKCRQIDQPIAALLSDLKERGLLEDTLVIWGGEFGRTPMRENRGGQKMQFIGRDHNPAAFTMWMAGGGVKPGLSYGETDAMGYEVVKDPVEVRDLHATILYLLGFDHHKLNYSFQGLDQKLTGVNPTRVIADLMA